MRLPLFHSLNKRFGAFLSFLFFLCAPAGARVFNSTLKLKVYVRGTSEIPDRVLGFTPALHGRPVRIPESVVWYVRPSGSLSAATLDRLADLMRKERIPGLDLSDHWELTDHSLSHLKSLPHLVLLDISRTKITDEGIVSLRSCRNLTVLMLPDTITNAGLPALNHLGELRELNLDETRLTDQGVSALTRLPHLENLDLSSTHVTDAGLAVLKKLTSLKRLALPPSISDASAPSLREFKNLREIDISQTQIGTAGLAALASLPKLRAIYLGKDVNDAGLKALSGSPSLKAIDLTRTRITDAGVASLSHIKTLEEVALSQTAVGNASLTSLSELPELRMLELSDTRVTSSGLAPLARLKKLEMLSLSWQTLSRDDLQGMSKLKQLKTIVLNGVSLPEATMAQLKRLGSPSPWDSIAGLEHARFRDNQKNDTGALSAPVAVPMSGPPSKALPEFSKPILVSSKAPTGVSLVSNNTDNKSAVKKKSAKKQKEPEVVSPGLQSPTAVVSAPAQPELITAKPSAATHSDSPFVVASLKDAGPGPHSLSSSSSARAQDVLRETPAPSAPEQAAAKPESEDNLLKVITLQSNPERAGAFSGLSGMRQLRHTDNVVAVNTLSTGGKSSISQEEDSPKNYLGEINASASH